MKWTDYAGEKSKESPRDPWEGGSSEWELNKQKYTQPPTKDAVT